MSRLVLPNRTVCDDGIALPSSVGATRHIATEHLKWIKVTGECNFKFCVILVNLNSYVVMANAMDSLRILFSIFFASLDPY